MNGCQEYCTFVILRRAARRGATFVSIITGAFNQRPCISKIGCYSLKNDSVLFCYRSRFLNVCSFAKQKGATECWIFINFFSFRPEMRRGYPLNLSILFSGGIENNNDSLSNGE